VGAAVGARQPPTTGRGRGGQRGWSWRGVMPRRAPKGAKRRLRGSGATRRVVRFARLVHRRVRALWRTFGPRRLRRRSQACPGCHPGRLGRRGLPAEPGSIRAGPAANTKETDPRRLRGTSMAASSRKALGRRLGVLVAGAVVVASLTAASAGAATSARQGCKPPGRPGQAPTPAWTAEPAPRRPGRAGTAPVQASGTPTWA